MTIAEPVAPVFPSKRQSWTMLIILFSVFAFVRVIALDADPPTGLSWSAGIFTDEGIYALDARSVILTGHWAPGDFHSAIIAPLFHLIQLGVFKTFGVGLMQARLISVFFSLATLIVYYEALCSKYGRQMAGIGLIFLGLSVPYVLYNRLALLETPTLFILVLAYLIWAKNGSNLVIGLLLGCAFVFKPLAMLAAPAFIYAAWPDARRVMQTLAGFGLTMLSYGLLWYIPHQMTLTRMNHYYAFHQYLPHSLMGLRHNLMRGVWSGEADGIFPYLLHHELPLSVLALVSLIRNKESYGGDRLLTVWLLTPLLAFLFISYTPSRYFVLFWPPLAALAARSLLDRPMLITISVVGIVASSSLIQLLILWPARTYTVLANGQTLPETVPGNPFVLGQFAPELCLSNQLKCIYLQPGLANDSRISTPASPSAALLITRSAYWDAWRLKSAQGAFSMKPTRSMLIGSKFVVDEYLPVKKTP